VFVSVRGDAIRVAPHLYNDDADIQRFLDVLGEALAAAD
jgi:selenocysteine lyase/cysteine desulfurase